MDAGRAKLEQNIERARRLLKDVVDPVTKERIVAYVEDLEQQLRSLGDDRLSE